MTAQKGGQAMPGRSSKDKKMSSGQPWRQGNGTGEKIQELLTDHKALSATAALMLIYVLLVAFWRKEKKNRERQQELFKKIEAAEVKAAALGIEEEECHKLAQYVVEQDLADKLPTLIELVLARLKLNKEKQKK